MKCRNGRFDLRPRSFFADPIHFEDRSSAISDIHQTAAIECDPCRNSNIAREDDCLFKRIELVNNSFKPAGDKHLAIESERDAGRIWDVSGVLRNVATDVYSEKRDRQLLTARSGARHKECAVIRIERRIRNRMKIAGKFSRDCKVRRFAYPALAAQFDFDLAALGFRYLRKHTAWAKRYDLRR